jgi:beta-lactam-binding protein with PASTA domain
MDFLKLFLNKLFLKHFAIAIVSGIFLFWIVLQIVSIYTRQGKSIEVPDLRGKTVDEVGWMDNSDDFEIVVIDSMFDEDYPIGAIVLQDPPYGTKVKKGRKIYVTIISTQPQMVRMPDLVDLSLRQALIEIGAASLTIDKLEYVENFAKNAVLNQKAEGEMINPGTEIPKGTSITLVLGKGLGNQKVIIPQLLGMTESEAVEIIYSSFLNVGRISHLDQKDPIHSRVYLQDPSISGSEPVEPGTVINLWFRSDLNFDFDELLKANSTDSLNSDSLIINDELF